MKRLVRGAAVAAVLALSAAAGATTAGPQGATRAISEWEYPRGGRDPLVPPAALYAGQDLPSIAVTLIGVDSHAPHSPLAVVRLDSRPPIRRVVRPGDRVGEYRIVRIRPQSVRVAAPTFGGTTVLELSVRDSSLSNR
jgi:hypothetical protein